MSERFLGSQRKEETKECKNEEQLEENIVCSSKA